jgi:hypothetical protein
MTVLRELYKYKLDLVGVQVRWLGGGIKPVGECTLFYRKGNETHELLCLRESYQQFRGLSLLVIGCHT